MKSIFALILLATITACASQDAERNQLVIRASQFIYDRNAPPVIADQYLYDASHQALRANKFLLNNQH